MIDKNEATETTPAAELEASALNNLVRFPSLCNDCSNARDTWSEKLKADGYIGCVVGLDDDSRVHEIDAETTARGWVVLGLATNGQIITRGTRSCPFRNKSVVRGT